MSTDYTLTVEIPTREHDPPPAVVLRRALRTLLRVYGVRCRSILPDVAPAVAKGGAGDAEPATGHRTPGRRCRRVGADEQFVWTLLE
jgi:hypothetical protein